MSDWGMWGYIGIVSGLVAMISVFLFCMVFMYRTPQSPETGQIGSRKDQPEDSASGTKHAA